MLFRGKKRYPNGLIPGFVSIPRGGGGGAGNGLLTDLTAYWKLDEASGTRNDSHGSFHLTATNSPSGIAGKINNGCDFDPGSSQTLDVSNAGLVIPNDDWAISSWFKLNSKTDNWCMFSNAQAASNGDAGLFYDMDGSITGGGGDTIVVVALGIFYDTGLTPSSGTWYHSVIQHVGSNIEVWIDGVRLVNTATVATPTGINDWSFGAHVDFGFLYNGMLDEIAYYRNGSLNSTKIGLLYNSGNALAYSNFTA